MALACDAGDMALVQALRQLDGDAGVGLEAHSRIQGGTEPESGRCLRARHVAAHRSCDSARDCPEVRSSILEIVYYWYYSKK